MNNGFFESIDLEPFLSLFFDNAPDLYVFAKTRELKFTMMNKALLKRLSLNSESQVIGKTDFDFFSPNMAELFQREDCELFEKGKPILNRTWSVPNGKAGLDWYISSKYPLQKKSGELAGYIGIMRGISRAGNALEPYAELSPVLKYIEMNFATQIEIQTLAELMHLSVSQFERRFKKLLNTTPLKFINKVRVDKSCEILINSYLTISTIALDCGFFDHSYFTKIFKKQMGITPLVYRRQYFQK